MGARFFAFESASRYYGTDRLAPIAEMITGMALCEKHFTSCCMTPHGIFLAGRRDHITQTVMLLTNGFLPDEKRTQLFRVPLTEPHFLKIWLELHPEQKGPATLTLPGLGGLQKFF